MIQGSEKLGFSLESLKALLVVGELFRKNLDGHVTAELRVSRAVDLTHSAGANRFHDFVVTELGVRC